jgi:hypothetical protein
MKISSADSEMTSATYTRRDDSRAANARRIDASRHVRRGDSSLESDDVKLYVAPVAARDVEFPSRANSPKRARACHEMTRAGRCRLADGQTIASAAK